MYICLIVRLLLPESLTHVPTDVQHASCSHQLERSTPGLQQDVTSLSREFLQIMFAYLMCWVMRLVQMWGVCWFSSALYFPMIIYRAIGWHGERDGYLMTDFNLPGGTCLTMHHVHPTDDVQAEWRTTEHVELGRRSLLSFLSPDINSLLTPYPTGWEKDSRIPAIFR